MTERAQRVRWLLQVVPVICDAEMGAVSLPTLAAHICMLGLEPSDPGYTTAVRRLLDGGLSPENLAALAAEFRRDARRKPENSRKICTEASYARFLAEMCA